MLKIKNHEDEILAQLDAEIRREKIVVELKGGYSALEEKKEKMRISKKR